MKRGIAVPLTLIIFFGLWVRISGIGFGYPSYWHPDEWRIVLETLSMAYSKTLLSPDVNYPSLFKYILIMVFGVWYGVGRIIGLFNSTLDFASLFFMNPGIFLIILRVVNAVIGAITVFLGYLVGKEYFGKKVGLIAALFMALEYQLIVHSQVGLHQMLSAMVTLPVFYYIHKVLYNSKIKNYVFLGMSLGVAASAHHTAILLIPSVALALYFSLKTLQWWKVISTIFLVGIFTTVFAIIGNLNWIFKFSDSVAFLRLGEGVSRIAFSSHKVFTYSLQSFFLWFFEELVKQDLSIGVLIILGVLFAIIRRRREDFVLFIFLLSYGFFFYDWAYRWLHLLVGLLPILVIYSAAGAIQIIRFAKLRLLKLSLLVLFILPSALSSVWVFSERMKTDTRLLAGQWVDKNFLTGSRVGIDWSAYNLNLDSAVPVFLLNPTGEKYFQEKVPQLIKNILAGRRPLYTVVQAMYNSSQPIWPSDMPEEEKKSAELRDIYRNLYSYFNFLPLDELRQKADYLVITSYTYSMFLTDNDPHKKNMFNIYLKDNILDYQSHTSIAVRDNRHGLLFYLAERGRDFYFPLLSGTAKGYKEIKRFDPGPRYSGPTVIIYQITKT